ncbi:acyl-coenzyme A thioesterase 13-like [Ischnura elegans]|uniref:acyl-coenzyme A thioesterase 13-like n=1 Tax=Ischnura elegans TaxID=197161 RepID=UPI001ED87C89|nr:acyl-coenzyme A thioesterase 13-like [Ischnura elegans]
MASTKGIAAGLVKNIMKYIVEGGGFDRLLEKVSIVSAGEGRCLAEMVVEDKHLNRGGSMHGGFTALLVDTITTVALMTDGKGVPGVSVNMNINYLKPAFPGEEILIDAKTKRVGKTMAFLDVDVKKKVSGDLIATGSHVKFIG